MDYITILIMTILFILHEINSQESFQSMYYQNPFTINQQYYQPQGMMNYYENEPKSYRRSRYYKKSKYDRRRSTTSFSDEYDDSYSGESEECKCSCWQCEDIRRYKPCCRHFCTNCQIHQSQSNLVFVPYAYPLIISKETTPATDTTTMMTTEATTSSSTESMTLSTKPLVITSDPEFYRNSNEMIEELPARPHKFYLNQPMNRDNSTKYILTSLRRTKPYWLPKYGIVPIPDRLAEKLLSHLKKHTN